MTERTDVVAMRDKLRGFVTPDEGRSIRSQLKEIAASEYEQQHSDAEYLEFMNKHACTFTVNHPDSKNHPYFWTLFTIHGQHVMCDCIEECLDKTMNILPNKPKSS